METEKWQARWDMGEVGYAAEVWVEVGIAIQNHTWAEWKSKTIVPANIVVSKLMQYVKRALNM